MDQAQGDLEHAKHDLQSGFYDWACFSAQQAAEKAAKAVFQKLGTEVWGHSVADILEKLHQFHPVPQHLIDLALELDKAYIPTRYPNAHPTGSPFEFYNAADAQQALTDARQVMDFVQRTFRDAQMVARA